MPRVKILGPLDLAGADGSVPLRRLKARQLFLLLVIGRNRLVTREALIDALWPGNLPSRPAASLRSYASAVHHAVDLVPGVRLTSERMGYTLRTDDETIDACCFEQLIYQARSSQARSADVAALEWLDTALALVRGGPLEEVAHLASAAGEVRRLQSLITEARERRLEVQLALGRPGAVVSDARILMSENPYRERLWELYARGLHRCGHTAAALGAIDNIRRSLDTRFGIDIGPSLAQLEADLREGVEVGVTPGGATTTLPAFPEQRGAVPGPGYAAPVRQMPRPAGDIVGRDADLCALEMILDTPGLTILTGPDGVGKTRLAVELVHRAAGGRVPFWCDLGPDGASGTVQELVAVSLGVNLEPGRQACRTLAEFIGSRQILLVLDSCDLAAGAVADLAGFLLARCSGLVILATSRESLHVRNENLFEVRPLPVPELDEAGDAGLDQAPATALLALRYREACGADLGGRLGPRMTQLSRVLGGMPLTIELAARQLAACKFVTPADLLPGTRELMALDPPTVRQAARSAHLQTMRNTIERSYHLASHAERRVLEAIASHTGPFTLDQAVAITSSTCPVGRLVGCLGGLINKSLLQVAEKEGQSWYRLPDVVRAYLAERRETKPLPGSIPAAAGT